MIKLVDRRDAGNFSVTQTHVRHILLRSSPQVPQEAPLRRLATLKGDIVSGSVTFEQAARDNAEDSSAAQGGDLGWTTPACSSRVRGPIKPLPNGAIPIRS